MTEFEKFLPFQVTQGWALVAMAKDTLDWSWPHLGWRISFRVDNERGKAGLGYLAVMRFVNEKVKPLCQGPVETRTAGLYLGDFEDVRRIFLRFRDVRGRQGEIATIQSREMYLAAVSASRQLARGLRGDPMLQLAGGSGKRFALSAQELPDIAWAGYGDTHDTVSKATVLGHEILLYRGIADGKRVWLLDVDGQVACAQDESLERARSKARVADAIHEMRRRKIEAAARA